MGELINLFTVIKGMPTEFTLGLSTFVAIIVIWMKSRDIDITAATSISRLQMEQVKSLMEQNKVLSDDLKEIRSKLSETYDIVDQLKKQILHLEQLIDTYEHKCDICKHKIIALSNINVQRND